MSDFDLLGPHAAIRHHTQVVQMPKRKLGSKLHPRTKTVTVVTQPALTDAQAAIYLLAQQASFRAWALEELERWRDRLPPEEYARQKAKLEADAR